MKKSYQAKSRFSFLRRLFILEDHLAEANAFLAKLVVPVYIGGTIAIVSYSHFHLPILFLALGQIVWNTSFNIFIARYENRLGKLQEFSWNIARYSINLIFYYFIFSMIENKLFVLFLVLPEIYVNTYYFRNPLAIIVMLLGYAGVVHAVYDLSQFTFSDVLILFLFSTISYGAHVTRLFFTEKIREARAALVAKSAFLANMSHEIRTPMNGIVGMVDLLIPLEHDKLKRDYLNVVRQSGITLMNVINDILDFSKLESGKMQVEKIEFDLRGVIDDCVKTLAVQVSQKKIDLLVNFPLEINSMVIGDPFRVRQVLLNIIGNAVKFTEKGYVRVFVSVQGGQQTNHVSEFEFKVVDTGIGISEEKTKLLFQEFQQIDMASTRRYGGTGLGLSISKKILDILGGSIDFSPNPEGGSVFTISVPLKTVESELYINDTVTLKSVRALIVDDSEISRKVIHEHILTWNMRNGKFSSGEEAIEALLEAHRAGDPYDIAIIDYQMPGMNGFEVAGKIKSNPEIQNTVLVLLSSVDYPEKFSDLQKAGFSAYLIKPITSEKLFASVLAAWNRHLNAVKNHIPEETMLTEYSEEVEFVENAHKEGKGKNIKILVAEDNGVNRLVVQRMLDKLGYENVIAENGLQAVYHASREKFDLLLFDIEMPDISGIDALARVRSANPEYKSIPAIAFTAHVIKEDVDEILNKGMQDVLSKPATLESLQAIIQKWTIPRNNENQ